MRVWSPPGPIAWRWRAPRALEIGWDLAWKQEPAGGPRFGHSPGWTPLGRLELAAVCRVALLAQQRRSDLPLVMAGQELPVALARVQACVAHHCWSLPLSVPACTRLRWGVWRKFCAAGRGDDACERRTTASAVHECVVVSGPHGFAPVLVALVWVALRDGAGKDSAACACGM